jgi:hypothetical protein
MKPEIFMKRFSRLMKSSNSGQAGGEDGLSPAAVFFIVLQSVVTWEKAGMAGRRTLTSVFVQNGTANRRDWRRRT